MPYGNEDGPPHRDERYLGGLTPPGVRIAALRRGFELDPSGRIHNE